jgi:two-component system OmpR family sensor kinase
MLRRFSVQISLLISTLAFVLIFLIYFYLGNIKLLQSDIIAAHGDASLPTVIDQRVSSIENSSFALFILITIFLFGIVINIVSVFIASLNRILLGISRFGEGDREYRINLVSGSELGVISDYLDKVFAETEEYERQISEISSLVSHQLKSPLTVIGGTTELLLENRNNNLDEQQLNFLNDIQRTQKNMLDLVRSVLDVSRLDKNEVIFAVEKIDIRKKLAEIVVGMHDFIKQNGVQISFGSVSGDNAYASGDPFYVSEVFKNLIDNAIRYSMAPAMINISIEAKDGKIVASFADHGIGIPEDEKEKITSRFYRATNAVTFKEGGTGLGLYIVKSVMEQMAGRFWFESKEGVGSTFYLEFQEYKDKS